MSIISSPQAQDQTQQQLHQQRTPRRSANNHQLLKVNSLNFETSSLKNFASPTTTSATATNPETSSIRSNISYITDLNMLDNQDDDQEDLIDNSSNKIAQNKNKNVMENFLILDRLNKKQQQQREKLRLQRQQQRINELKQKQLELEIKAASIQQQQQQQSTKNANPSQSTQMLPSLPILPLTQPFFAANIHPSLNNSYNNFYSTQNQQQQVIQNNRFAVPSPLNNLNNMPNRQANIINQHIIETKVAATNLNELNTHLVSTSVFFFI